MSKSKQSLRREFCHEMGWDLIQKNGTNLWQVVDADGTVLLDRNQGYVNGYLDGLWDGMRGTPWVRSRRHDGSR